MTPRQNAATKRASTARPKAAAMQHANTIDLSNSLFIRVLYAMARVGEALPGATVTFLLRLPLCHRPLALVTKLTGAARPLLR